MKVNADIVMTDLQIQFRKNKNVKFAVSGPIFNLTAEILKDCKIYDPILKSRIDCRAVGFFFQRDRLLSDRIYNIILSPLIYLERAEDNRFRYIGDVPIALFDNNLLNFEIPTLKRDAVLDIIDSSGDSIEELLEKHNKTTLIDAECFFVAHKEYASDTFISSTFLNNTMLEQVYA